MSRRDLPLASLAGRTGAVLGGEIWLWFMVSYRPLAARHIP
jgi:hypothetical protein